MSDEVPKTTIYPNTSYENEYELHQEEKLMLIDRTIINKEVDQITAEVNIVEEKKSTENPQITEKDPQKKYVPEKFIEKLKKIKNLKKNLYLFWFILILLAEYYWRHGLTSCEGEVVKCVTILASSENQVIKYVFIYSLILIYIFISSIKLPIQDSKLEKIYGISLVLISFTHKALTSKGTTLADHSQINFTFAKVCVIILTILYIFFWVHVNLLPKKFTKGFSRFLKYSYYSFLIFGILRFYFITILRSCDRMDDGVIEKEGYCKWEEQSICWHYVIDGLFKPVYWFGRGNCENYHDDFTDAKKIAGNTGIVSFPLLTDLTRLERKNQYDLPDGYLRLRKQATEDEILNGDREVFVDFREKESGEVKVKLKNLVERDEKIRDKVLPHDEDHPNIFMIFIDTLSKHEFHRKYKNLQKYFKDYSNNRTGNLSMYEFYRFHSIRGYTFPNLALSNYGHPWKFLHSSKQPKKNIDSLLKEKGYITGLVWDACFNTIDFYNKKGPLFEYHDETEYHHVMNSIGCDPNPNPNSSYAADFHRGFFATSRNCLGKKPVEDYVMDYAKQFFDNYRKERKFLKIKLAAGHEFTGEYHRFLDKALVGLFEKLEKEDFLDNMVIMVFSDHGNHMNRLVRRTKSGMRELMSPYFMTMLTEDLEKKYGGNLKGNQQEFTTHYDMFKSLLKITGVEYDKEEYKEMDKVAYNIFGDKGPESQGCKSRLVEANCRCYLGNKYEDSVEIDE